MTMKQQPILIACALAALSLGAHSTASAQSPSPAAKEVSTKITGAFDVKMTPQDDKLNDGVIRMLIDKQYHGDLEATSKGQMLASGSAQTSGVYVAIETVTGTLKGQTGSFALHHTGIMTQGKPSLTISVVPGSGTGQLTGIAGQMIINIADGKHFYEFTYTLP